MRMFLALLVFLILSIPAWASQHNPVLSTTSPYPGLTMLGDANNSFAALLTNNSAATAPSYGVEGTIFDDSTDNYLEIYSGSNWLIMGKYTTTAYAPLVNGAPLVCPTSTGSANAYVVTDAPTITALVTGNPYCFITNFANTGSATVNLDGLGAKTLKKNGGTNLASADFGSGVVVQMTYDGTSMQVTSEIASAAAGGVTSIATTSPVCGGTITTTGTITLCTQSNNTVLANISGSTGIPAATGVPVVTSWGLSGTSAASGTFTGIHETTSNNLTLSANGADVMNLSSGGTTVGSPTGGAEGAGTLNATALYVQGVAVATGSSAGLTLLHTINCTSGSPCSSVVFSSSFITGTYTKYVLQYDSMTAGTSGCLAALELQVSANNGSTYLTSGYSATASIGTPNVGTDGVYIHGAVTPPFSSTTPAQGDVTFSNPSLASAQKVFQYNYTSSAGTPVIEQGSVTNTSTAAFNNVKVIDSSGVCNNIVGNFSLYGYAH